MIGVFDSGLGGLTAVKEIQALLPRESLIYFGDTGRVPYGTKTRRTIMKYAVQDVRFLLQFSPKAILVACGTVSSTAMEVLHSQFDLPIIGVVEGAAEAAVKVTKNGKIGIIGTAATIRSGAYAKVLYDIDPSLSIVQTACPLFVPLVESGFTGKEDEITRLTCERYLKQIREAGCDTLILGCTHYPIIAAQIANALPGVRLISSGAERARTLKELLTAQNLLEQGEGSIQYYVSDDVEDFSENAALYLDQNIDGAVHKIDIEAF